MFFFWLLERNTDYNKFIVKHDDVIVKHDDVIVKHDDVIVNHYDVIDYNRLVSLHVSMLAQPDTVR